MGSVFDFSGWATKNDILCADGRTIRKNAFAQQDGLTVPLVWSHRHDGPENVLGHALLENRPDGVYTYCKFNDTPKAQAAKMAVEHGDVTSLSIYANQLKQNGGNVMHGTIREVSLVLAGANPGAWIDVKSIAHADDPNSEFEAEIYTDEVICHSVDGTENIIPETKPVGKPKVKTPKKKKAPVEEEIPEGEELEEAKEEAEEEEPIIKKAAPAVLARNKKLLHADPEMAGKNEEDNTMDENRTVQDVFDEMTDEQKTVVYALIGQALEGQKDEDADEMADELAQSGIYYDEDNGGWIDMKNNVFDNEDYLAQSGIDEEEMYSIFADAKTYGNLRDACLAHGIDDLMHAAGPEHTAFSDNYMPNNELVGDKPYSVQRPQEWAEALIAGCRKVPFARIKSIAADITANEARAKGYVTGNQKVEEVITALKRETNPTTIYKLQKIDRDDILDITDFDIVAFLKDEMKVMLQEKKAEAILVGDQTNTGDNKVSATNIRPIYGDSDTYTLYDTDSSVITTASTTSEAIAELMIERSVRMRENYYGSGNLTMFISRAKYNDCFLLKDTLHHRLYKTQEELAGAFDVAKICVVPAGIMDNLTKAFTINSAAYTGHLFAILVDLKDYTIGSVNDGHEKFFDDFNIDYNQMKYLIEERLSGALTAPKSAIVLQTLTADA